MKEGIGSELFVYKRESQNQSVCSPHSLLERAHTFFGRATESIIRRYLQKPDESFTYSPGVGGSSWTSFYETCKPTILNLHWVNAGFVHINQLLSVNVPIVWTLHDMWAFTGGCHYNNDCRRFEGSCGHCPSLRAPRLHDRSWNLHQNKQKVFGRKNFTFVCPSRWLASEAKKSSLLQQHDVRVIPNGIDTEAFKPMPREKACEFFKLDPNQKYILFGAVQATRDPRKGFDLLLAALKYLEQENDRMTFTCLVFGSSSTHTPLSQKVAVKYLGAVNEDSQLALLYSLSSLFVCPSRQDNLPNTVVESLACGTPVVAFDIGGMKDLITHETNGFLAKPFDPEDLARGIKLLLKIADPSRYREASRVKATSTYSSSQMAHAYLQIFTELQKSHLG
jgi:glycosyltransferase involved in cell wall biosynthesis